MVSLISSFLISLSAFAHEGPPYPILVDQPTEFGELSVWSDPDVGEGTFILWMDTSKANVNDFVASVQVQSHLNREKPVSKMAVVDSAYPAANGRVAYVAKVPFDHEGEWDVGFVLEGKASRFDRILPVTVTPPGPNETEFVIYLMPFVILGALWIFHFLKRRAVKA